jgi:hypothetical protein
MTAAAVAELRKAWVLASRDDERAAWNRLYDALHPRPECHDPIGGGHG